MLRWSLANGAAYREAEEAGAIPDGLEPPFLWPGLSAWYDAFHELSTDRQQGMGFGPLPAASIDRYTAGWPQDDADAFRICMREMDSVYLAHFAKRPEDEPDPEFADSAIPAREAFRDAFRSRIR